MASFGILHHVAIDMDEEEICTDKNEPLDGYEKSEVYLDNVHFFTKYLSVQNLDIRGHIAWPFVFQLLENILLSCSSDLVQVAIKMSISQDFVKGDDPRIVFCGGNKFNKVKKLDISFRAAEEFAVSPVRVGQILPAFPNIKDLSVGAAFLPFVFPDKNSSPRFLSTLRITKDVPGSHCTFLLNLTHPLKYLHIEAAFNPRGHYWDDQVDIDVAPVLYQVLCKHRHTLEYLALGLEGLSCRSVWKLPNFPNLKRFTCLGSCEVEVTFESGSINYSETFPKLESLGFAEWHGAWTHCFQSFFPARTEICQSVRRFYISGWVEPDSSSDEEDEKGKIDARFGRILNFFPNADNPFMQKWRLY
ncbi:uncharacterized protein LOC118436734 [Folsomia candida]|uniref:uncharacterized protein LOC118436734 n=1 Tax=Folsomia candida TaxID=158441 RepID=UPI001604ED35|nr:uncharacterized protein LOC118436734 [Folsomia candida]